MELKFNQENPQYEYITEPARAVDVFKKLLDEKVLGIDTETTGLDPYTSTLLLVQIGTDNMSFIFDARLLPLRDIPEFRQLMESMSQIKLMHNCVFDYKMIKHHTGVDMANMYDLMLAEGVLTAGLSGKMANLAELCFKYLDINLDKNVRKSFANYTGKITSEMLAYSGLDTLVLFPIFDQQIKKLKQENVLNIAKLEFACAAAVGDMEYHGVSINVPKWKGIIKDLELKRTKYAQDFQDAIRPYYKSNQMDLFGNMTDAINLNSQTQLMDLFNNRLGVSVSSTGDEVLKVVNHPIAEILRSYRGYEKLISAFGDSLLSKVNPVTHKLHPRFNQLGAATGRFSCSNPNLQQIPRNSEEAPFRECFNPSEGYKLVVADYSSMEMRILADLSGDEKMIMALRDGLDIHSFTAALMFNKEYTSDFKKKYPDLRQIAKPIGFGLVYGMGSMGLAGQLKCTQEMAQDYIDKYFSSYPSVRAFLDNMAKNAVKEGWSSTPGGRKRWYKRPDANDPDFRKKMSGIQRQAKNHPIQGTNADATKFALVFLRDRLKQEGVDGFITHTVHDEIVCEIRADQAEDWAKIQSAEMVRAGELFIKKVPVVSDPFVGDVWEH